MVRNPVCKPLSSLLFKCCWLALPLAFGLSATAARGEQPVPDKSPAVVRFSTAEVRPWGYLDERGHPQGTLIQMADRLRELTGLEIHNHIRPYPRTIHEIEKGEVDFAVMFAGPASEKIGVDVGSILAMNVLVAGRPDHPAIQSLDDLAGKTVGYIRGSLYGPAFDHSERVVKMPVKDMEQGLQMLLIGRIDAMVGTDQSLYYTLHEMNVGTDKVKPLLVLYRTQGKLYFSRASSQTQWIEPFRKALQAMRENGELERIFALPGIPESGP